MAKGRILLVEDDDALDHPVQEDEIGRALLRKQQRLLAIGGVADLELLALQMVGQELGEGGVVLDE